jgi:hypothetical protein
MICYYWPETGKSLDDDDDEWDKLESADGFKYCRLGRKEEIPVFQEGNKLGSVEDLKDCREGSQGISNCQLGRGTEMRSAEDLKDCHEDGQETLHFQLSDERRSGEYLEDCQEGNESVLSCLEGRDEKLRLSESLLDSRESSIQQRLLMKMGSVDLIVCQGSGGSIPYFQVGMDEQIKPSVGLSNSEVSWNQLRELTKQVDSRMNVDQEMQLTGEEEHQDGILMIGGIEIFLPFAQEEAENSVQNETTAGEQSQLMMTVKEEEELEKVSETAQVDEEKNECSEEKLNKFSQQVERAIAFELTVKEIEGGNEHSEEWLDIFSISAENTTTREVAEAEEEDTDNIGLVDLWEQIEALEDRVKVQGMHIQQVRLETDEEGMGDHDDLPNGPKFLQLGRLQQKNQPLEQLDEAIKEIMDPMLKSADTARKERLRRRKEAATQWKQQQQQQNGANG